MLASDSQTKLHVRAMLLDSHAVLVPSVPPLSHPDSVCPSDSMSRGRLPHRRQHAVVAAAWAQTPGRSLRLARQNLRRVLRFDSLQWWAIAPPLPLGGVSAEGRMVRTSGMR